MNQLLLAMSNRQGDTWTWVAIGAAVLGGLGLVYFMTRGGGRARRNPAPESGWPHYNNPVMERTHRAKRGKHRGKRVHQIAWFKPSEVGRARSRGWSKRR